MRVLRKYIAAVNVSQFIFQSGIKILKVRLNKHARTFENSRAKVIIVISYI